MGLMEFRTPATILARIRNALIPILLTNYKVCLLSFGQTRTEPESDPQILAQVWPFVQCVMFLYVPLQYRVPLSGVVRVAWTVYLSWENARTAS